MPANSDNAQATDQAATPSAGQGVNAGTQTDFDDGPEHRHLRARIGALLHRNVRLAAEALHAETRATAFEFTANRHGSFEAQERQEEAERVRSVVTQEEVQNFREELLQYSARAGPEDGSLAARRIRDVVARVTGLRLPRMELRGPVSTIRDVGEVDDTDENGMYTGCLPWHWRTRRGRDGSA